MTPSPDSPDPTVQEKLALVRQAALTRATALTDELTAIAKSVDAAELLAVLIPLMSMGPPSKMTEARAGTVPVQIEHLAFHLWPYAYDGVCRPFPQPEHVQKCLNILPDLVRYQSLADADPAEEIPDVNLNFLISSLRMHARTVRGSAYPEQTAEEIVGVQGYFDSWFHSKTGIAPSVATRCVVEIIRAEEREGTAVLASCRAKAAEATAAWKTAKRKPSANLTDSERLLFRCFTNARDAATAFAVDGLEKSLNATVPVEFEPIRQRLPSVARTEWDALKSLVGFTAERRRGISDPFEVRKCPLYVLPDGRVLIADISTIMDAIWDAYEVVAFRDAPFFSHEYVPRRSTWVEGKVAECLSRVFPPETVHRNARYPDPSRPKGEAETDCLVSWGPFIVVVETKAQSISEPALLGELPSVRRDVRRHIVDPMIQADRVLKYLASAPSPTFRERSTGQAFTIAPTIPPKTFSLAVSQHHLSGLATDLKQLEALHSPPAARLYPFSVCLADLDVITRFCEGPEIFLHFLQRRLALQGESFLLNGDEQDIFLAYLKTRLSWDRFTKSPRQNGAAGVSFLGWGDEIRQYFQWLRKETVEKPDIRLEIPRRIVEILGNLRKREDDAARWIAFALLDLPDVNLNSIAEFMDRLAETEIPSGVYRTFLSHSEDTAVYIVGSSRASANELKERTPYRTALEKHKRRKEKAVGLSFVVHAHEVELHTATWIEGKWQPDEALDKLADEIRSEPIPGTRIPGRNDPCVCGSGKKYKKCHGR